MVPYGARAGNVSRRSAACIERNVASLIYPQEQLRFQAVPVQLERLRPDSGACLRELESPCSCPFDMLQQLP
jgi:hypothetical protein